MMNGLEFKEAFEKEKYEFKQLHPLERYAFILLILFTLPGLFGMFGVAIGIFVIPSVGESIAQNAIPSAIIAKFISICLLLFIRYFLTILLFENLFGSPSSGFSCIIVLAYLPFWVPMMI